jgi:hypothetical protein
VGVEDAVHRRELERVVQRAPAVPRRRRRRLRRRLLGPVIIRASATGSLTITASRVYEKIVIIRLLNI